jgi:hypothetical protein
MSKLITAFRHIRCKTNKAAITAAINFYPEDDFAEVGFAFCSPHDQFCKKTGRMLALKALAQSPVPVYFGDEKPLFTAAMSLLMELSLRNKIPRWVRTFLGIKLMELA